MTGERPKVFGRDTITVVHGLRGVRSYYAGAFELTMAESMEDRGSGPIVTFRSPEDELGRLRLEEELRAVNSTGVATTRVR